MATIILVVEDEVLLRMLAQDILVQAGYSVLDATNAEEALTILDARPDVRVLFTDVKMPGSLDGYALAHIVSKKRPEVSILVASGAQFPGQGDLPASAIFIQKPYSPSALLEAIEELTVSLVGAQPVNLEMAAVIDPLPSAQNIPAPVQEPEKK